jgi:hypothetical protein
VFTRNRSMHIERGEPKCSGGASCSCSTTGPRHITLLTNLMSSHIAPFLIADFNMLSTVVIVLTLVVAVYGHECKDFKLSAADQSVIDMIEHYLHTSRKNDNTLSNTFKYINT